MSLPQEWNPSGANQETDEQYAADNLRSGGAQSGAVLPAITFNKALNQLSRWIVALSNALRGKGITVDDSSTSGLTGQLSHVVVDSDLTPYALLASPTFTGSPKSTTPPAGDSSTRIATTSFVAGLNSLAANGYAVLPSGLIIQWGQLPSLNFSNDYAQGAFSWPIPFPNACFVAGGWDQGAGSTTISIGNRSKTGATQFLKREIAGTTVCQGVFIALGN